jgi:hypothetical protein
MNVEAVCYRERRSSQWGHLMAHKESLNLQMKLTMRTQIPRLAFDLAPAVYSLLFFFFSNIRTTESK